MIRELEFSQFEETLTFVWGIQSRKESASFPMLINIEEMRSQMQKVLAHEDDKILVFTDGGERKAVVNLFVDREEKYLGTKGAYVLSDHRAVFGELFDYVKENYPGYQLDMTFPMENVDSAQAVADLGAELIESSVITRLYRKNYAPKHTDEIAAEVTDERFEDFAAFHGAHCPATMYWNAERIREERDQWKIFAAYSEGKMVAAILYAVWNPGETEIFALTAEPAFEKLDFLQSFLSHSLSLIFKKDWESVLFFIEEGDIAGREAAASCGFQAEGSSRLFRLALLD